MVPLGHREALRDSSKPRPNLAPHLSVQYLNGGWVPVDTQRTRATFLSSKALDCAVPSLSNAAVDTEDLMMVDRPYARWEMKVTSRCACEAAPVF